MKDVQIVARPRSEYPTATAVAATTTAAEHGPGVMLSNGLQTGYREQSLDGTPVFLASIL